MKRVYDEGMEQIERGEELGYDGLFVAEHAFYHHGKPSPHVLLGKIAARTERIRIGTAVSVLPWHNPLELAHDYAMVDLLSDGRLDFGVGRGLFKGEFDGYSIPCKRRSSASTRALTSSSRLGRSSRSPTRGSSSATPRSR